MATPIPHEPHLPNELLLIIKQHIDPFDLRTHVCYYLSSPRVSALYDSELNPDAFWALACWNCGIGAGLNASEETGDFTWKDIAIDCIIRDGFCEHPQCGEMLLEYNRRRMRYAAGDVKPLEPLRGKIAMQMPILEGHILFKQIEFKCWRNQEPVERDAHLRAPGAPARRPECEENRQFHDDYPGLYFEQHPLAARSFATSFPVVNIDFCRVADTQPKNHIMQQERAIIILDILKVIHAELDEPLTVTDLCDHLGHHYNCVLDNPWDFRKALGMMRTIRSLLTICPILDLEQVLDDSDNGPLISVELR
ncbi:hypothetical protein GY45DRAFT_1368939 [Cubamyces sp. BRFM 1775]|nr:hypothetical protein GY45DRAFT_1368939 [Cubamyces sp. BRFM 1775]